MTLREIEEYFDSQDYGPDITHNFTLSREMKDNLLTLCRKYRNKVEWHKRTKIMKFQEDEELYKLLE